MTRPHSPGPRLVRSVAVLAAFLLLSCGETPRSGRGVDADTAPTQDATDEVTSETTQTDAAVDTSSGTDTAAAADTISTDARGDAQADTAHGLDTTLADDATDAADTAPAPVDSGMWISRSEILSLPMSGPAWDQLLAAANQDPGLPNLADQDQDNNVYILAKAFVYVRTGDETYRTAVRAAVMAAMETENGGRTLALGRELAAYVIAAELVGLEPAEDAAFRPWLDAVRFEVLDTRTLVSTHEDRPNNWGTHAGASRLAASIYLGDTADVARAAQVFKGWLGDRASYAGFSYGELSWQADEANPVGINPMGAVKAGEAIDGVIPDDMRRGCPMQFPPCPTNYPWGGLEGAIVQAELLYRQGYDAWTWQDEALRRAVQFLWDLSLRYPNDAWWAAGDDEWQLWLVNHAYGTTFPAELPARAGKNMGWNDWTHDRSTRPRQ